MKIIGKVKSWDGTKDCFGISNPNNTDHIWPVARGGSNVKINLQRLSVDANEQKRDKSKGKIGNKWKFSILKKQTKDGLVYGVMYIRNNNWKNDEWKEVTPVE